jgi:hypothetical protein
MTTQNAKIKDKRKSSAYETVEISCKVTDTRTTTFFVSLIAQWD